MNVNIVRIDPTLPLPKYETKGSFAFDLSARVDTTIPPRTLSLIPSNSIIQCPDNLALKILPRSSTFRKKGLTFPHSIGLIDADYCGENDEIMIQVFNNTDSPVTVERGERIAQGLFVQIEKVSFTEIQRTDLGTSRGGFGSTG